MKTKLVEKRSIKGRYDFKTASMILDTDTMGRILIVDGWGGDDINGFCYRWRHGLAIQLQIGDTFDILSSTPWNDTMSRWDAVRQGCDPDRRILDFNGFAIAAIAKRH
jgi:hypothetical protein